jgi:hypothetical protein
MLRTQLTHANVLLADSNHKRPIGALRKSTQRVGRIVIRGAGGYALRLRAFPPCLTLRCGSLGLASRFLKGGRAADPELKVLVEQHDVHVYYAFRLRARTDKQTRRARRSRARRRATLVEWSEGPLELVNATFTICTIQASSEWRKWQIG